MELKKVLLIGGSGFVGGWVANRLSERGIRVIIPTRHRDHSKQVILLPTVYTVEADVHDPKQLAELMTDVDAVVNLVGILHDGDSRLPYGKRFAAAHVELPKKILAAMKACGVRRLVHISALKAAADAPSGYLRSKAAGEALLREAANQFDITVLRPSVIFGPGDSFLNTFATLLKLLPALPLAGGGARLQPVYVGDVAEAIARGVTRVDAAGRTYELGGPSLYTFREVLELVRRETGRDRMLVSVPFIVAKPLGSLLQLSRFVGLTPPLTRDQVLMLEKDNVVAADAFGLSDLGIDHPAGMAAIAPSYLWRYRVGGQFAEAPAH